ncbi:hypothetical protein [Virgibacillus dokdonensis]|uniref:Uncharacterized protein n=1 Tax=Virgibacillus dokdonensis TaxID=302167 RepID=A0A2K9IXY6_9BACI|nr:hypothetical protein [Virgibacillus dokdonensis]AUJ24315.1 hypothetical protein A21D_01216 [Virgibacillus dokdonensis]
MTQYFYIASPKKLKTGVVGSKPISPAQPNVFKDELDATGLFFEANYDAEIKKRFDYAPVLSFKYQVAVSHNLLPLKHEERCNRDEERCLTLLYEYMKKAIMKSGVIEVCTCINGTEERDGWDEKSATWSNIKAPYDLVLNDRECWRIIS